MANSDSSNFGHFDDLVFEKRNRSYGAFIIRRQYTFNIIMGLVVGFFIIGSVLAIPYVQVYLSSLKPKKEVAIKKQVVQTLQNPESLDEEDKEEKQEVTQEAPKQESVKFTVPIVTDKEVDEIITNQDLELSNPGKVNQVGEPGIIGMPGDNGDEDIIGDTESDDPLTFVEQQPSFPGGEDAWKAFLEANLEYPSMAREQGIEGTVWLKFVVDKFGNVTNIGVVRGPGGGLDEEAVRVLGLSPRWNPGKQGGRPVKAAYNFPIIFKIN